jgi:serine/threonine protein kinase
VSVESKDLINRMLQPNPIKRITLAEIKEHPWFAQDMPAYLLDQGINPLRKENEIDHEIVKKLFTLNFENPITKSYDEVVKDIRDKKNTDYCGAFELMRHDKLKKECFKQKIKEGNTKHDILYQLNLSQRFPDKKLIFEDLPNSIMNNSSRKIAASRSITCSQNSS